MKVFGVDFDGTQSFGQWPCVGPANEELKYSDVIGVQAYVEPMTADFYG